MPPSPFLKIHFNIILPYTLRSSRWFPSLIFYTSVLSPYVLHVRPFLSSWFDHPSNIWWVQVIKLLVCSLLHVPVISPFFDPNVLLTTYSRTPSAHVPPSMWATKFHTHTKQKAKLQFCVS
jgi:hypothetical protein